MVKGKKWILSKSFSGNPTDENLQLLEYELPNELQKDGIILYHWSRILMEFLKDFFI